MRVLAAAVATAVIGVVSLAAESNATQPQFTLSVQIPGGGGSVTGSGIMCPGKCQIAVPAGAAVALTARPDPAHSVGTWTGCASTTATCTVVVDKNMTVAHTFRAQ